MYAWCGRIFKFLAGIVLPKRQARTYKDHWLNAPSFAEPAGRFKQCDVILQSKLVSAVLMWYIMIAVSPILNTRLEQSPF
jgi:hypothetical protein